MQLSYLAVEQQFKFPFTISKGTKTHQPKLIVALHHLGFTGYGEAPAIHYYDISIEKLVEDVEKYQSHICRFSLTEPERFWHFLHHLIPHNPFLVCALDMAAWDLFGKLLNKPLHQIWKADLSKMPLTDYTIGIDEIQKMIDKINQQPWPIYKVKVGFDGDMDVLQGLRKHTEAKIRVDANAAWGLDTAQANLDLLKQLDIELIEQPLAKDDVEGMKILFQNSTIPLIADESCVVESDVPKCKGLFHGINIKLTKCSGATPALRMIKAAQSNGLKIMIGSMCESMIGSAAIAHLAPFADYVDNDGSLLLDDDLATGLAFDFGKMILSDKPGLGIEIINQDLLEALNKK